MTVLPEWLERHVTTNPLSHSSVAATAEEAAYRIDYPLAFARDTRVIAFDAEAERIVREVADNPWGLARFYTTEGEGHDLITLDGERRPMAAEITHSNSVIMVATNGINAEAVATVGAACKVRSIMTAGLLVTHDTLTSTTLTAIRPHARILLVPADQDDLFELLKAIRA